MSIWQRLLNLIGLRPADEFLPDIQVTDFLHTFYDSDTPLRVRLLKLRQCCRELKRLAFYRPVIVMTQELEPITQPALF